MTLILTHATVARGTDGYGLLPDAAIVCDGARIVWVGPMRDLVAPAGAEILDCGGRLVTPGLIDCHSHAVFAGTRAEEFELRVNGASYAEVARAGGGILSTVRATRAASEDDLVQAALPRIDQMIEIGRAHV